MTIRDPRLTPARPDLAARHLQGEVEAAAYADAVRMRVGLQGASVRRAPQRDAALDTEALPGEFVDVYERSEGWAWGQLAGDGYVGYLPEDALWPDLPEPTHRVAALRTFAYPGPSIKLPPLAALSLGAAVTVREEAGDFALLHDGTHLWRGHLAAGDAFEADYVAVAERFLGVPYLWGGKTSLGLDCSGLTQLSLAAAGVDSPRDSDQLEAAIGAPVALDDALSGLRRGDLVFWKGHVGIMSDGDTLLHATGHAMSVVKEPLRVVRDRILSVVQRRITSVKRLG